MSTPSLYNDFAISYPLAVSEKVPAYLTVVPSSRSFPASGFTLLTPAINPASNFLINGVSVPPINPILFVLVVSPARTPAKKDPSSSLNVRLYTLSPSTTSST